jgi:hypothetical protein
MMQKFFEKVLSVELNKNRSVGRINNEGNFVDSIAEVL